MAAKTEGLTWETITDRSFLTPDDVAEALGCSHNKAAILIRTVRKKAVEAKKLPEDYPRGKVPKRLMAKYYI